MGGLELAERRTEVLEDSRLGAMLRERQLLPEQAEAFQAREGRSSAQEIRLQIADQTSHEGFDAVVITDPSARYRTTSFYNHDMGLDSAGRTIISADGNGWLITDNRFTEQVQREAPDIHLIPRDEEGVANPGWVKSLVNYAQRQGWKKIGFDPETLTKKDYDELALESANRGIELAPSSAVEAVLGRPEHAETPVISSLNQDTVSPDLLDRRLTELQSRLKSGETGAEAILITSIENVRYLTGKYVHDRETDELYSPFWALVKADGKDIEIFPQSEASSAISGLSNNARIIVETQYMSVAQYNEIAHALGEERLVKANDTIELIRQKKDPWEIEQTRQATEITDQALQGFLENDLYPGMTEQQAVECIDNRMKALGATSLAFPTIVASGPNAALPHHIPGDRQMQEGETIIIDMGARYNGYCADMTRTVFIGYVSEEWRDIYNLVLHALQETEKATKAEMPGVEIDRVARDIITRAGHGAEFLHGTGHATGLDIHEDPRLGKTSKDIVPLNSIVTIEPGIYVAGKGGVRIEDAVVVGQDGIEILTSTPKDLPLQTQFNAIVVPIRRTSSLRT